MRRRSQRDNRKNNSVVSSQEKWVFQQGEVSMQLKMVDWVPVFVSCLPSETLWEEIHIINE